MRRDVRVFSLGLKTRTSCVLRPLAYGADWARGLTAHASRVLQAATAPLVLRRRFAPSRAVGLGAPENPASLPRSLPHRAAATRQVEPSRRGWQPSRAETVSRV